MKQSVTKDILFQKFNTSFLLVINLHWDLKITIVNMIIIPMLLVVRIRVILNLCLKLLKNEIFRSLLHSTNWNEIDPISGEEAAMVDQLSALMYLMLMYLFSNWNSKPLKRATPFQNSLKKAFLIRSEIKTFPSLYGIPIYVIQIFASSWVHLDLQI